MRRGITSLVTKRGSVFYDRPAHRGAVLILDECRCLPRWLKVRLGTEQSRRHAFLTTLLRVPHLVLAVNKMDLVDYEPGAFSRIVEEFTAFGTKLEIGDLTFIPISALHGDNVVERSLSMPWYNGPSLLHHLEHVHIASDRNLIDVRFPVQYVIRPHQATDPELHDYRGYAGQVAAGS